MSAERRLLMRRNFSYYMRVLDEATGNALGHVADISTGGLRLETKTPLPLNSTLRLRLDQMGEIANKNFMTFTARVRWCRQDYYDPTSYNIGVQVLNMAPSDYDIFVRMFNTYGTQKGPGDMLNTWR